jgi:hypothetical protein
MSVPIVPVRPCKLAVVIERHLGRTTVPSPSPAIGAIST